MLVCSANWLLPDGSLSAPPPACEITGFVRFLHTLAWRAGFRQDGRYAPIERVDLVLAGDLLDTLSSRQWHAELRPWQSTPAANQALADVARSCLRQGRRAVGGVRRLCRGGLPVPAATPQGRPSRDRQVTVPVRAVMLQGDRDPRPDLLLAAGSETVPWQLATRTHWGDRGQVFVCHGHSLDPATAGPDSWEPRSPSLQESLAVDLVGRFVGSLQEHTPASNWRSIARLLATAPPLAFPNTISAWGRQLAAEGTRCDRIDDLWRQAVAAWHREARRDPPSVVDLAVDITDRLAGWLDHRPLRDEPPLAPTDVVRWLSVTPDEVRSRARRLVAAETELIVLGQMAGESASAATADDPITVTGLGRRADCLSPSLSATAVFEHGEHGGSRLAHGPAGQQRLINGYAPAVVGKVPPEGVVDAVRAA